MELLFSVGENNGFKPNDCEVKLRDLRKAWSLKNKDWRYLLDPANWGTGYMSELGVENGGSISSLPTVPMEEVTFQAFDNQENDDQEVEMATNISSSSKKRKLIHLSHEKQVFPSHSYDSYAPPPQSSSDHIGHLGTARNQVDMFVKTMNILQHSFSENDHEESDKMSDPFEKDIDLSEQKSEEEAGLEATQLVMKVNITYLVLDFLILIIYVSKFSYH